MNARRWSGLGDGIAGRKILLGMLMVYLLLSALEVARTLAYDTPREYDAGFYLPESVDLPEGRREFMWTRGGEGHLLRPLWGPAVRIPVYVSHPRPPADGLLVSLYSGDTLLGERRVFANGWHRFDYYLPPILGVDPWRDDQPGDKLRGGGPQRDDPPRSLTEGVGAFGQVPGEEPFGRPRWMPPGSIDLVRTLADWHARPGPPSRWFRVQVSETFVAADYAPTEDRRKLGVGVGEILWLAELPPEGLGMYGLEHDAELPFRWSARRGSLPVVAAPRDSAALVLQARVASPTALQEPVEVTFYWNQNPIRSMSFDGGEWRRVRLPELERTDEPGVLSVRVSRTWNPAAGGTSADDRELGVALGETRWR